MQSGWSHISGLTPPIDSNANSHMESELLAARMLHWLSSCLRHTLILSRMQAWQSSSITCESIDLST